MQTWGKLGFYLIGGLTLFHNVIRQVQNQGLKNVTPRAIRARILDAQNWDLV